MKFFSHVEGYVDTENGYEYVYQYRDHLGNVRLSYLNIGTTSTPNLEIQEEDNYYPFGLQHKGYNNLINGTENNYQTFQGQELIEDLGLNCLDFGARNYMPDIGKTLTMDHHSESYFSVSPYSFFANNPISFTDPTGTDILFWRFNSDGDGDGECYSRGRTGNGSTRSVSW